MGSLNVAEWSPDQVAEWLKGLGPSVEGYVPALRARGLGGAKLLTLRCDDLEYLGIHVIGHQEIVLEAIEHLRNFQYELSRECVQQLALRVSVAAGGVARALRTAPRAATRLETQAMQDVARAVGAVKALVCWLERWPVGGLRARGAALLALCLEAATSAQRERFAEQPARAVAAAAAAAAAVADHIIQDVLDPLILQPASLDTVTLRQGSKPLGFAVVPSFCGHHQLAAIRFGSPAHASGAVHEGDEIVQVGNQCVIGWSGAMVERACAARGAQGELTLRLRRRAARRVPALPRDRNRTRLEAIEVKRGALLAPAREPDASSSDSEPLSPPASPTLQPHHTRMYPPKPRAPARRRHSVSCASPTTARTGLGIEQFWQQLQQQHWRAGGSAGASPAPPDALYARDKAVSCSTGLELSPRPRTCLGVPERPRARPTPPEDDLRDAKSRGKLDKSHSTPAYDFGSSPTGPPTGLVTQVIPESPTTPADSPTILVHSAEKADQILDFKKSSSQIEEAILQQKNRRLTDEKNEFCFSDEKTDENSDTVETINNVLVESHDVSRRSSLKSPIGESELSTSEIREEAPKYPKPQTIISNVPPEPPPRPAASRRPVLREPPMPPAEPAREYPVLRSVRQPETEPTSPLKPIRIDPSQISLPLRHITKHDIRAVPGEPKEPLEGPTSPVVELCPAVGSPELGPGAPQLGARFPPEQRAAAPAGVRSMFPAYKSKSLKKKNSILAKRRSVAARALAGRGAGGSVWQRVRARHASQPRWARRYLLLADSTLYAYRSADCARADCMIQLAGFTAAAAGEVKSRPHAFKVYHTGTAFYFACESADAARAWLALITRATHEQAQPQSSGEQPKQYSETDYSTDSDVESERTRDREREREKEKEKEKDKSKFGSLKKLTHRMQRSESSEAVGGAAASLDRKYLRFFSRAKHKDDAKPKSKQSNVPVPTEHYRSYRRVSQQDTSTPAPAPAFASPPPPAAPAPAPRLPKPINYIHASNPNLLDFEKSEFAARPARALPVRPPVRKPDNFVGFVTLEEFMLKKQEEERRQVYTNRVLLGVERTEREREASLQRRLQDVVPSVVYGALPSPPSPPTPSAESRNAAPTGVQARSLPPAPPAAPPTPAPPQRRDQKPISVKGKDGYEKIVYTEDKPTRTERMRRASPPHDPPAPPARPSLSTRRNDKAGAGGGTRRVAPLAPLPAAAAVESVAVGGGAGVSRLRLMFLRGAREGREGREGRDGHETTREVHRQESVPAPSAPTPPCAAPAGSAGAERGNEWAWRTAQYPHLQCPPTFQPESYSLASRFGRPPTD